MEAGSTRLLAPERPRAVAAAVPRPGPMATQAALSLSWFGIAGFWLLAAPLLGLGVADAFLGTASDPRLLALTHAWVLGFLGSATFGAIYQLLSVAVGEELAWPRLAWIHGAAHAVGVPVMVVAFLHGNFAWVAAGGSLVALGALSASLNIGATIARARTKDAVAWAFGFSAFWLGATVIAGFLLALNRVHPVLPGNAVTWLKVHAHMGIVGFYVTLLQGARDHAVHPEAGAPPLTAERLASGVDDGSLDTVVAGSVDLGNGLLQIPHAALIHARIVDGVRQMLQPLKLAPAAEDATATHTALNERLDGVLGALQAPDGDCVPAGYIDEATRADRTAGDSLHIVLLDLHRELNRLQAAIASESIGGARVYGIANADRTLVEAFMAGVNATAPLKFDHPGLATTATRAGDRLVLQNDLGATDAHVLVIHVTGLTIRIIYTDVHPSRIAFFESMLAPLGFVWSAPAATVSRPFEMRVGEATVKDDALVAATLTRLGSRLVFLIDWNRARKKLARLLRKGDAVAVLTWAADHDVGHRAFLQLGDIQLVSVAMERVARAQMRFGARLDEILGRRAAIAFVQAVLRIASDGLRQNRSARLIQDEIEAELLAHFQTAERGALQLAEEHAALIAALAGLARDAIDRLGVEATPEAILDFARRAKKWETLADDLVKRSRDLFERVEPGSPLLRLLVEADDVADGLEESAFLLTLVRTEHVTRTGIDGLRELADLITRGSRDYVRCIACGEEAHRTGGRSDLQEFLVAVDALIAFEHASDERERAVTATLVEACRDFRELHVLSEIAKRFEDAADALARCSIILRDYVLNSLKAR